MTAACHPDAEPRLSLETLIETATLFSSPLDNRSAIRNRQDEALIREIMASTATPAQSVQQAERFYFGSLDFLVSGEPGAWKFHPIELNGSAVIGISSLPLFILEAVCSELTTMGQSLSAQRKAPLFLIPFSSGGSAKTPLRALHERILFAQAVKNGFRKSLDLGCIVTTPELVKNGFQQPEIPTVVLGFIHDVLPHFSVDSSGLRLLNRRMDGTTHDQLCDIIHRSFSPSPSSCFFVNDIFQASADKSLLCERYNRWISQEPSPFMGGAMWTRSCDTRDALIQSVCQGLEENRQIVIKPRASALGRGIEFFLGSDSEREVVSKIDAALSECCNIYSLNDTHFPYSVCGFINGAVINSPKSYLHEHKFEMRVFVFREKSNFYAIPSIVKASALRYDAGRVERNMLLNNVAVSTLVPGISSQDFILPLANDDTLSLIGLERRHLFEICQFSTGFLEFLTRKGSQSDTHNH